LKNPQQELAAQEVLAAQASDQRDKTNALLAQAVNVLLEQLGEMKKCRLSGRRDA